MMGEAGQGSDSGLSPPVVCSRCGGVKRKRSTASFVPHTFFPPFFYHLYPPPFQKKNGCSVLHALADLHNVTAPLPPLPQNKSGLPAGESLHTARPGVPVLLADYSGVS